MERKIIIKKYHKSFMRLRVRIKIIHAHACTYGRTDVRSVLLLR